MFNDLEDILKNNINNKLINNDNNNELNNLINSNNISENNNLINTNEIINQSLDKMQNDFLSTKLVQAIDKGIDFGLKIILPDYIEDQVLDLKNSIVENGVGNDIKNTVENIISINNNSIGINNNYNSINEAKQKITNEELLDKVFGILETAINGLNNKKINSITKNKIENNKLVIKNSIEKNIDNSFNNQVKNLEKLEKYINNWNNYFQNQDFSGMQKEYYKMNTVMKEILPLEETINNYRYVENMQKLIKNNNKSFNLSEDEIELANKLFK